MHIDPRLYPSIVVLVVAMNDKVQKSIGSQNYDYKGIYVSVDTITQEIAIPLLRINHCL